MHRRYIKLYHAMNVQLENLLKAAVSPIICAFSSVSFSSISGIFQTFTPSLVPAQDARGDQCDSCGNLLNPTDLINPKCKITGTTPVLRSTKHIFLDLPQLSPQLQAYITETSNKGGWSNNCVQVRHCPEPCPLPSALCPLPSALPCFVLPALPTLCPTLCPAPPPALCPLPCTLCPVLDSLIWCNCVECSYLAL